MRIKFLGGVREVTGSTHLLMTDKSVVMRDCGLFQGRRSEARDKNRGIWSDIGGPLDAVVLSHAHIDHCGNLPTLAKHGYRGPIHATHPTADLCQYMLHDSAHIQELDARYVNRKLVRRGEEPVEPLYSDEDVDETLKLFEGHSYHQKVRVTEDIEVTPFDAGHILGAALHVFDVKENGHTTRVGYAFDLGRDNLPIINDPEQLTDIDALVIESTYGSRYHRDIRQAEDLFAGVINRTVKRGGKIIIPSFALERAQEVLHTLETLFKGKRIPRIPVYLDSPLAINVLEVFLRHPEVFDEETLELLRQDREFLGVTTTRSTEESKALNDDDRPMVIISASGMCESGRILHHLKNNVEDPKNAVVIVGYQAQHTLGRRIVEREPELRIFGKMYDMRAERVVLNTFSGHADRNDLLRFVDGVGERCTQFILVHGENSAIESFAAAIRQRRPDAQVQIPDRGDELQVIGNQ